MRTPAEVPTKVLYSETLATRLSAAEMRAVEAAALTCGISRSQWLRDAALAHLQQSGHTSRISSESVVLSELMALRLLILNLFPAAIPGLPLESIRQIMAYADSRKHVEAAKSVRSWVDGGE
jgi:hypothetical protein